MTVTSGGSVVAAIDFSCSYTTSRFHITSGTSGTVEIFETAPRFNRIARIRRA
jgi:hypothetical protein